MIEEVSGEEVIDFALSMFPEFKISNSPFIHNYIYKLDKNIVGFITFSRIYENIEIEYIGVRKECRGKNIAKSLLDYMLNVNNVSSISLEVRVSNEEAIKFYKKNNFEIVSIRKNYYKDEDGYLMVRNVR